MRSRYITILCAAFITAGVPLNVRLGYPAGSAKSPRTPGRIPTPIWACT